MGYVEIEIRAKTVDLALEAAMKELGVDDPDLLAVEVVQEPVRGFLGIGGEDAVVRVKRRRQRKRKRRKGQRLAAETGKEQNRRRDREKSGKNGKGTSKSGSEKAKERPSRPPRKTERAMSDDRPTVSLEEQADIVRDFLDGLVTAYGLEGEITARVEDEVIVADISGEQTEALVGVRGTVRSAIHELTRTVLQKFAQETGRLRLDIAGYGERRRQALSIYAEQLIDQLLEEGGEIMLEPMSPADRKVIHDIAAEREGVTSYSEGEPPRRYVVLSRVEGDSAEGPGESEEE